MTEGRQGLILLLGIFLLGLQKSTLKADDYIFTDYKHSSKSHKNVLIVFQQKNPKKARGRTPFPKDCMTTGV